VRPLGIVGLALIALGAVVLALGGISYIKERESAKLGPIEVSTELPSGAKRPRVCRYDTPNIPNA
jgi:hypothetical protein